MSEKISTSPGFISPTEKCEDKDLGFFDKPTEEFRLCQLENQLKEFQDFIQLNLEISFIELLQKSPIIDSAQLRKTEYDPLQYFSHPPVIGIMQRKWSEQQAKYLTFKEWYGEEYKNTLFSTDTSIASSNGLFITYNDKRWLLTAFHSGLPFMQWLEWAKYPKHRFDQIGDSMFIELDDTFLSNIDNALKEKLKSTFSPISITTQPVNISSEILWVLWYDEWWDFSEEYPSMKFRAGLPFQISQEFENQIIEKRLEECEQDRELYVSQYTWEELDKKIQQLNIRIAYIKSTQGEYVWKYMYRISEQSYVYGAGLSGSPVLQKGKLVWIHIWSARIAWMYFSYFTPINSIRENVLSKME